MKTIHVPDSRVFERGPPLRSASRLRALVARWSDDDVVVLGLWPLLAALAANARSSEALVDEVVASVKRGAGHLGAEAPRFFEVLASAPADRRVRVLAGLARQPAAVRMLVELAGDRRAETAVRRAALEALEMAPASAPLVRLATRLSTMRPLAVSAAALLHAIESRRSSTLEQIASFKLGDVLRDRGHPFVIEQVWKLGSVDFGATMLEFWDPVQVEPLRLRVKVPRRRAHVVAALSGGSVRCVRIEFAARPVVRWRRVGATSSPFGILALSRSGMRAEIERFEFDSSFWDDVFDDAFDFSDVAAVVDLQLGPVVAWCDGQQGGALFSGEDQQGKVAALLFDAVRNSSEPSPRRVSRKTALRRRRP